MNDNSILLKGLDGSNPLAFLAALGTLRTLTQALPDETVQLSWELHDGGWRPRLWCPSSSDSDFLITHVVQSLPKILPAPWTADKRLPFAAALLQHLMLEAARSCEVNDRAAADLLAAFGSETFIDDKGNFADTAFRMVRSGDSAGQGLLYYACKNAASITVDDVRTALFEQWVYVERGSSFRWDPVEDRMYALQANNPSSEKSLSVPGANRLALEALAFFPVQPTSTGAITTGFVRPSSRADLEFRWPIWAVSLTLPVIASLLASSILSNNEEAELRRGMGVVMVFKSRQFKPNQYYRNFSPGHAV